MGQNSGVRTAPRLKKTQRSAYVPAQRLLSNFKNTWFIRASAASKLKGLQADIQSKTNLCARGNFSANHRP